MKKRKSIWEIPISCKVIFLDKDGVLNHQKFYTWRHKVMGTPLWQSVEKDLWDFCPESIKNLNALTDATGAKIVLSASMRHNGSLQQIKRLFKRAGITGELIGITPSLHKTKAPLMGNQSNFSTPRGCEIDWWLREQGFQRITWSKKSQLRYLESSKVKNYVILDDDADMLLCQAEHFVKTNAYKDGFNKACLKKAINILNTDIKELYLKNQDL